MCGRFTQAYLADGGGHDFATGGTEMLVGASSGLLQAWPVSGRIKQLAGPADDSTLIDAVAPGAAAQGGGSQMLA
jgi:hypothetical protein